MMKNFETFISESKIENSHLIKSYNLRLSSNSNMIILIEDSKYIVGTLEIFKLPKEENYRVENVVAVKGYGPLLYEYCLTFIYPSYLGTYKSQTKEATKIWNIFKDRSSTESNIKIKEDISKFKVIDFMISGSFKLNKIFDCPDNIEYYLEDFQNQISPKKLKI